MNTIPPQVEPPPIIDGELQSPGTGRSYFWLVLVGGGILAFFLLLSPFGSVFLSILSIKGKAAKLRKPAVYEPVARTLALYCQSDQKLFPENLSYAWLPSELARIGHGRASVSSNFAHVEMGGGFFHFGYHLKLVEPPSDPASNVWQLSTYAEGSGEVQLMTLVLASTQHFSSEDLLKTAMAGFDESIQKQPRKSGAFEGKILLLLRFGKLAEALKTCQDWIKVSPENWLPRLTYAHLRCRQGGYEPASAEFGNWVNNNQNFATCTYLALFHFREGRTNEALRAVELALKQPLAEPPGTDGNKFYLGHNGAVIAFINGNYDLCLLMCNKMLADPRHEQSWTRTVWRLKAAGLLMKADQKGALEAMAAAEAAAGHSPFGGDEETESDKQLRNAIQMQDTAFVKNPKNWLDKSDSWFSPFETDETGIHGATDIPTPYPRTWTTDKMRSSRSEAAAR